MRMQRDVVRFYLLHATSTIILLTIAYAVVQPRALAGKILTTFEHWLTVAATVLSFPAGAIVNAIAPDSVDGYWSYAVILLNSALWTAGYFYLKKTVMRRKKRKHDLAY